VLVVHFTNRKNVPLLFSTRPGTRPRQTARQLSTRQPARRGKPQPHAQFIRGTGTTPHNPVVRITPAMLSSA